MKEWICTLAVKGPKQQTTGCCFFWNICYRGKSALNVHYSFGLSPVINDVHVMPKIRSIKCFHDFGSSKVWCKRVAMGNVHFDFFVGGSILCDQILWNINKFLPLITITGNEGFFDAKRLHYQGTEKEKIIGTSMNEITVVLMGELQR